MSQPIKQKPIDGRNNKDIRSIEGSEWTLETASSDTIEDGNAQGNGIHTINVLVENSPVRHRRVPLPLELNCQIFEYLKFGIQRKFIGGLGRGIYAIFRQKLVTKTKRLGNPKQNGWEVNNTDAIISSNSKGLLTSDNTENWQNVFAKKGFPISGKISRTDNFPGTILYYFEVTIISCNRAFVVGLSSGNVPNGRCVGLEPNSYAIPHGYGFCWLTEVMHPFEWPNGAINPKWNGGGDVIGCGLVLNPQNKLSIFFTGNGILMGKPIPIDSTANSLYPSVSLPGNISVEANFGDDSAKPFKYDFKIWEGLDIV